MKDTTVIGCLCLWPEGFLFDILVGKRVLANSVGFRIFCVFWVRFGGKHGSPNGDDW